MGRAEWEHGSGTYVTCSSLLGCGGSGKRKGKTCGRCAGKGMVTKSVRSR